MTRRNSSRDFQGLDDLSAMQHIVVDKRNQQRSSAKKSRRNRHYEKQFIRNVLSLNVTNDSPNDSPNDSLNDSPK